jgi:hypothetical protein
MGPPTTPTVFSNKQRPALAVTDSPNKNKRLFGKSAASSGLTSKKSKKTKVKKRKQPNVSPYATAPNPLIIRQKYTIEEKYIGKQTSVVNGVQKLKCLHKNLHLKANQGNAYVKKIGYLIEAAGTELALKIFVLAGLMSTLLENVDNKMKGGKDVPHPLYVFSRFQPIGSEAVGVCRYAIEITPPLDKTNLLKKEYNKLLVELDFLDVKHGLLQYKSAIDRMNWLRKILVMYIAWSIKNNNDDGKFKVFSDDNGIVYKVEYSINYEIDGNASNDQFTYADFTQWCKNAFLWIENLLNKVLESKFKKSQLLVLIQGPNKDAPSEAKDDMDYYLESMLQPKPPADDEQSDEEESLEDIVNEHDANDAGDGVESNEATISKHDYICRLNELKSDMNSFLERKKENDVKLMEEITQRLSDNTESMESTQTYIEGLLDSIHNNLKTEIISKLEKEIESPQVKVVNDDFNSDE